MGTQNKKKLGIALGGGGPRGIAHIGVLQAFEDAGIKIDMFAGTSVGSLVAALYIFGIPLQKIKDYALNMSWWTISKPVLSRFGLVSNEKMRDIVVDFLGARTIEEAPIPIKIVATDITTGEEVVIDQGDIAHAVMASSSIPGIFTPVVFGDRLVVDGGLSENVPLSVVKDMQADVIIGVDLMTKRTPRRPQGLIDVMMNAFDITMQHTHRPKAEADIIIRPNMDSFIKTEKSQLEKLYSEGYKSGQEAIPAINKLIA